MSSAAAFNPDHGTVSRYNRLMCRCDLCRAANAAYGRECRRRRAAEEENLRAENARLRVRAGIADRAVEALAWIHAYLGSECDWDELDDGYEVDWYVNTGALIEEAGAASGASEQAPMRQFESRASGELPGMTNPATED